MQLNLRYVTQGMIKLQPEDTPENLFEMTREELLEWANGVFDTFTKNDLVEGVRYLDPQEDTQVGCVELESGEEDYPALVETHEWVQFFRSPNGHKIAGGTHGS